MTGIPAGAGQANERMADVNGFKEYAFDYDFIVVGGGLTGLCAAIAAARHGVRTALVQDRPVLGGNCSSEIRMHICGASENQKKPELNEGGIIHELMLNNKRVNDSYCFSIWDAVLYDAAKREPNLTLWLNTTMLSARAENGTVHSIECYQMTTEKRLLMHAGIFSDCTGNGTLGAFVGAPWRTGSEGKKEFDEPHAPAEPNNERMGNTLLFKAANVGHPVKFIPPTEIIHFSEDDLKMRKHSTTIPPEVLRNATEEEIRMLFDGYCQDYGFWWIELSGEAADIIEEYEDIRDQLVKAVYGIWDHIKNTDTGAENYELTWVGMLPGMRESRRFEGDYMLTEKDVLENRRFPDAVAYGGWQVDNHTPHGLLDMDKVPSFVYEFDGSYDIPYRCLMVKGFTNLYAAGRCMSASKLAMASSRVMATCAICGQAVGTAAAQAVNTGKGIRDIDIGLLQQTLLRDDCYIPGIRNTDAADLARGGKVSASSEQAGWGGVNVLSGVTRSIDGENNGWRSEPLNGGDAWLQVDLAKPGTVREIQLVLDSNFNLEKKITLSSRRQLQQKPGVPEELLRDFDVTLLRDGKPVAVKTVTGCWQRLVRVPFDPAECDAVRLTVHATNGAPEARVFEVRAY